VCQSKHVPHHEIGVLDGIFARSHVMDTTLLKLRLHGIPTCSIQLVVHVLGHPHVVVREERSLRLYASGRSENLLGGQRFELVSYGISTDSVLLGRIRDLEHAVIEGIGIQSTGFGDSRLADLVEVTVWIAVFVLWHGMRLFVCHRIVMTIDCGVDTCSSVSLKKNMFKV